MLPFRNEQPEWRYGRKRTPLTMPDTDPDGIVSRLLRCGRPSPEDFLYFCSIPKLKKRHFDMLLNAGADVHVADAHGKTALFSAAESGNLVLLRTLLALGLDPMRRDDAGVIPLSVAVRCGNLSIAQCLLEMTPDPAAVTDAEGSTLLHDAAWGDMPAIARRLVDVYGVSPEARDHAGRTPLHVAAYQGSCRMLKFLLEEKSADINARDRDGRTPLFSGAYDSNLRALKILCEHDAELSVKDRNGLTALEFASGRCEFAAAKFLGKLSGAGDRRAGGNRLRA